MITVTILYYLILLIILAIPVLVGCYVYKDAKRRGMDAVLWTIVAILVPGLIGLIVYLVIRENTADAICPECENDISSNHAICPYCGNPLKLCCGNCNIVIDPAWKLCPQCGTEIKPEDFTQIKAPQPKKDKGIRTLITILIVLPLAALAIIIAGMAMFSFGGSRVSTSAMCSYQLEANSDSVSPEVRAWVADCDAQGAGVYVL